MRKFRDLYKEPVNNQRVALWFWKNFGRNPSIAELQEIWDSYMKSWSDQWYALKFTFNDYINDKKKKKPTNIDPVVTEDDALKWIDEFSRISSTIQLPPFPEKYGGPNHPEFEYPYRF